MLMNKYKIDFNSNSVVSAVAKVKTKAAVKF